MKSKDLEKLIDPTKYQVFLLYNPVALPFSFAVHPWFVVNQKGIISRWEIIPKKNLCPTSWGHLHMDFHPPFHGTKVFLFSQKYFWQSFQLCGMIQGQDNSMAQKIAEFIITSKDTYPFKERYVGLGPNSNTYVQWVLKTFPEFNAKLPWNAVGKNYKRK